MKTYRTRQSPLRTALRGIRYAFRTPAWITAEHNECEFYSQFIQWGSVCFDIGANEGNKTHIFHLLGARVVAVDPVPMCANALRDRFKGMDVIVEECAVGSVQGQMPLHIGDSSTISSLVPNWIERNPSQLTGRAVSNVHMVSVVTLDSLIKTRGVPHFCKIDVEGYELEVLKGLSHAIRGISFEFTGDTIAEVDKCTSRLQEIGGYEFNFTFASPLSFEGRKWTDSRSLIPAIEKALEGHPTTRWGDVIARLR
jgi:FkbM family methyltransferase